MSKKIEGMRKVDNATGASVCLFRSPKQSRVVQNDDRSWGYLIDLR